MAQTTVFYVQPFSVDGVTNRQKYTVLLYIEIFNRYLL